MGKIDKALAAQAKNFQLYDAKDENGSTVQRVVGWPSLTIDQMQKLNRSKAGRYNNTGKIPYTAIINPHTLAEMSNIKGSYGMGQLTEAVEVAKKALNKEYGQSVSRKSIAKFRKDEKKIRADADKGNLPKAINATNALVKKNAKKPKVIQELGTKLLDDLLTAAQKQLDEAEALIGRGDKKGALKTLNKLARPLKGTAHEARVTDLLAKAKAE